MFLVSACSLKAWIVSCSRWHTKDLSSAYPSSVTELTLVVVPFIKVYKGCSLLPIVNN